MTLRKEVNVGQLLGPIIFIIGLIGSFYALGAKVDGVRENVQELKTDIREIRKELVDHLKVDRIVAPETAVASPKPHSRNEGVWYPYNPNTNPADSSRAGRTLRPGSN